MARANAVRHSNRWDARIRRADELARKYPFASEILSFYRQIAKLQRELAAGLESARFLGAAGHEFGPLRECADLTLVLPRFPGFLEAVALCAPAPLAARARELTAGDAERELLLAAYWQNGGRHEPFAVRSGEAAADESAIFCARAFLEPVAELLAAERRAPPPVTRRMVCPLCGAAPQLGVLRPEGDGAKRFLVCSFCCTEWDFVRIVCSACGEEDEKKQCLYTANEPAHVRVEACDRCKSYLLTVDLTKYGLAVPVVDELAALPLNLWARQNGYSKIHSNLLGM
jgi:FdhE protein